MANKIPDETRDLILSMHKNGHGRNAIAKVAGVGAGTVTAIVKSEGGSFGERAAAMETATKTRKMELAERRSKLELDLLKDAERLRRLLWSETLYVDHGGKEFDRVEWTMPTPVPADQLKLMQAATMAVGQSLKIADAAGDQGVEAAKSMLAGLGESLAQAWQAIKDTPEAPAT